MNLVVLGGEVAVPHFQQPAIAGRNSSWRRRRGRADCGAALKVGSDAMVACEPRQGRKTATVSLMFHVPSGRLAGALTAASKPTPFVETRCTTFISERENGAMECWSNGFMIG